MVDHDAAGMMMIAFINFNSCFVPLIEGLSISNPWEFGLRVCPAVAAHGFCLGIIGARCAITKIYPTLFTAAGDGHAILEESATRRRSLKSVFDLTVT